jgi:hypothetical protein
MIFVTAILSVHRLKFSQILMVPSSKSNSRPSDEYLKKKKSQFINTLLKNEALGNKENQDTYKIQLSELLPVFSPYDLKQYFLALSYQKFRFNCPSSTASLSGSLPAPIPLPPCSNKLPFVLRCLLSAPSFFPNTPTDPTPACV